MWLCTITYHVIINSSFSHIIAWNLHACILNSLMLQKENLYRLGTGTDIDFKVLLTVTRWRHLTKCTILYFNSSSHNIMDMIPVITAHTALLNKYKDKVLRQQIITSWAKEVMFLVSLVSLSVCLFVCYLLGKGGYVFGSVGLSVCLFVCLFVCGHYSKSYERIGMKFYGRALSSTRKNWLNFGGDLGIARWVNEQKYTVIVVAYPDRGEGNDPEPFFFFFFFFFFRGVGSLSQPRLNTFTVGNMGVMICLGQGGLHSLSASSLSVCLSVCLSVDNITQKVMNGLGWNFMDGSWVVQGRTD